MKKENISDAVGALSDDIIEDAAAVRNTRSARPYAKIAKFAALAAVFALCIVGVRYMPSLIPPSPPETTPPIINPDEHPDMYSESPTGAPTEAPIISPDEQASGGIKATEYNSLTTSFEGFSGVWADCIDAKLIREWTSAYEGMDYSQFIENVNIYTFIRAMNIPKDMFYEVCYLTNDYYSTDYDIELLYNGTLEDVKEYYRNSQERETEFRKKNNELKIKLSLLQLVKSKDSKNATEYYEWTNEKYEKLNYKYVKNPTSTEWRTWSIPEFIYRFDISREEMEKIISVYNSNEKNITFDYDLDLIYNDKETIKDWIAEKSPMEVDELIHSK